MKIVIFLRRLILSFQCTQSVKTNNKDLNKKNKTIYYLQEILYLPFSFIFVQYGFDHFYAITILSNSIVLQK